MNCSHLNKLKDLDFYFCGECGLILEEIQKNYQSYNNHQTFTFNIFKKDRKKIFENINFLKCSYKDEILNLYFQHAQKRGRMNKKLLYCCKKYIFLKHNLEFKDSHEKTCLNLKTISKKEEIF